MKKALKFLGYAALAFVALLFYINLSEDKQWNVMMVLAVGYIWYSINKHADERFIIVDARIARLEERINLLSMSIERVHDRVQDLEYPPKQQELGDY